MRADESASASVACRVRVEYLETLPHLANSDNNTFWVIPGELTEAVRTVTSAFGDHSAMGLPTPARPEEASAAGSDQTSDGGGAPEPKAESTPSLDAAATVDEATRQAAAAVNDARAEAEAASTPTVPGLGQRSGD